jgi:gamma-glutamylcyclotransferase (GGCT)/AIG2-like uncharacterized protein YtfP
MKQHVARIIPSNPRRGDSLLFVYGTLRPFVDIPMARWLRGVARYVGPARARGRLYDLGPYPGLRPSRRSNEWVAGDLYRVRNPRIVRRLDRYEAGGGRGRPRFVRRACVVWLGRRRRRAAWVYVYERNPLRRSRIEHGDYFAHRGFFLKT